MEILIVRITLKINCGILTQQISSKIYRGAIYNIEVVDLFTSYYRKHDQPQTAKHKLEEV